MEQVIATISDDEGVLRERVTAWIQIIVSRNRRAWEGYFTSPQTDIDVEKQYLFKTTDSRSGRIHIVRIFKESHRDTRVEFVGDGPLE